MTGGKVGSKCVRPNERLLYYMDDEQMPPGLRNQCIYLKAAREMLSEEIVWIYQYIQKKGLAEDYMSWRKNDRASIKAPIFPLVLLFHMSLVL